MLDWWDEAAPASGPLAAEGALGEALRQARYDRVWSQKELAGRSGVAQSVISRLERGVRSNWQIFCRLLEAMGLEPVVTVRRRQSDLDLEVERIASLPAAERLAEHHLILDWLPRLLPPTGWALDGDSALLAHGVPVAPSRFGVAIAEAQRGHERIRSLVADGNAPFDFRFMASLPPLVHTADDDGSVCLLPIEYIPLGEPGTQMRAEREEAVAAHLRWVTARRG